MLVCLQWINKPTKHLDLLADPHFLQLTSKKDLRYQDGGAYDSQVFGYVGRPANLHASFSSVFDISADYQVSPGIALTASYALAKRQSVVAAIYPVERSAQYGYVEMTCKWHTQQRSMKQQDSRCRAQGPKSYSNDPPCEACISVANLFRLRGHPVYPRALRRQDRWRHQDATSASLSAYCYRSSSPFDHRFPPGRRSKTGLPGDGESSVIGSSSNPQATGSGKKCPAAHLSFN